MSRLEADRVSLPLRSNSEPSRAGLGLKTINRIGALTLAIGVIFFFKYAVDENLIGAASGVFVGVLLGCVLLAAGEWLIRRDERVFAQGVSGCGLAIIYISTYAAFAFYKILLESAGFAFLTVVSGVAVFLSIRYRNPAIATLGFIGALLTPILLSNSGSDPLVAFPFLLLVAFTALFIGIRQQWAILIPVVAPMAAVAAAFLFEPKHHTVFIWFALSLSAAHFAAYAISRSAAAYIVGHCALLLAGLRWLDLSDLQRSAVRELASLILGVYGTMLLAYGLALSSTVNRLLGLVLIGIVIGKLYLLDVWVLARVYRISAFVGLGALLLLASYFYSRSDKRRTG